MQKEVCNTCHKEKSHIARSGKSKGMCKECYRKLLWKPKKLFCPRCERMKPHHAQGLCDGCYNSVFQVENVKLHNARRYHNVDFDTYKETTKKCVICGFDKIVDLHHLDLNHKNNSQENLVGLCPNHHKMLHHREFQKEIFQQLKEKGYSLPEGYKEDQLFLKKGVKKDLSMKDKPLNEIQKSKMKEIWNNKQDEAWNNI